MIVSLRIIKNDFLLYVVILREEYNLKLKTLELCSMWVYTCSYCVGGN